MGYVGQKFGFMQGWSVHSATAMYPLPTGELGGFFRDPKLYLELSQADASSRGQMSWQSARRLSILTKDQPWVADRLLVGLPPREITIPAGPESAEVLPPTFGPSKSLSNLNDVRSSDKLLAESAFSAMLGLHEPPAPAEEYVPVNDFIGAEDQADSLVFMAGLFQERAKPAKLLAQRLISERTQGRMENIPLKPEPEDVADIKRVISNALTEKALYFVNGSLPRFEKLAETMWFSMLWYGFSKFSPERQADIAVVMENLDDELHDRLLGAVNELNATQLDRKLIGAATLAVVHPEAFTVDLNILDKAVRALTELTAHRNSDVSHNASHMLVRMVKIAGDAHPEVVARALTSMVASDNLQVAYTATELLARVVESNGIEHNSVATAAMQAMNGAMIGLGDRIRGGSLDAVTRYFADRYLRIGVVYETSTALRAQVAMEKLAELKAQVQERLAALPA